MSARSGNGSSGTRGGSQRGTRRSTRYVGKGSGPVDPGTHLSPSGRAPGPQRIVETNEETIAHLAHENEVLRQQLEIQQLETEQRGLRSELGSSSDGPSTEPESVQREADDFLDGLRRPRTVHAMATIEEGDEIYPNLSAKELGRLQATEKGIQTNSPNEYYGKNIDEHRVFFDIWETVFELKPYTYHQRSRRVLAAAVLLRGEPQKLWRAEKATYASTSDLRWEKFKTFLRDLIVTPSLHVQESFEGMRTLEQYPDETVNGLLTRFYALEAELGPATEINRIRTLDAAVHSDIQDRMAYQEAPATLLEWIAKATRAEHLLSRAKKSGRNQNKDKDTSTPGGSKDKNSGANQGSKPEGSRTRGGSSNSGFRRKKKEDWRRHKAGNSNNSGRGESSPKPARSVPGGPVCWTCDKPGHFSGDPKCEKYDEWKKQQKDKAPGTKPKGAQAAKKDSGKEVAKP